MKKETLGQVLKQRRAAYALTQRELARKLGVKASHVAYLENGRRRPSLSLLSRLANTLDLDRQRLFLLVHPEAHWVVGEQRQSSPAKKHERHMAQVCERSRRASTSQGDEPGTQGSA